MIFIYGFLVALCAVGLTEWVKNFLPAKLKENKIFMSIFAAAVAIVGGIIAVAVPVFLPELAKVSVFIKVVFVASVVALTQTYYTILFKTFKTIKDYLTEKIKSLKK